jgi:hypothetical protein
MTSCPQMGPMGEPARASPRARGGGVGGAGGRLRDAAAPVARHRGLVVARCLPAPDAIVTRLEQERGHAGAPPTHFDEAQAEQPLWQEF